MIFRRCCSHDSNLLPMNLLRSHKRHLAETMTISNFPMNAVQPRERFRLVVRHFETGHPQGEAVPQNGHCIQRGKMLSRKRNAAHLGLTVVRVVVVLVVTGSRLPA